MKATGIIVLILVIFATAVLAEVWRELHCFKIPRYQIRTGKIKGDAGKVRIVFLSDLHNHVYGKENEELLSAIREAKPDLILAGGDMLDGVRINGIRNGRQYILRPDFNAGGVAFYSGAAGDDPSVREARQWIDAIRNDTDPCVTPEQAFCITQILEGIYTSASTGAPVYFS